MTIWIWLLVAAATAGFMAFAWVTKQGYVVHSFWPFLRQGVAFKSF